MLNHVAKRTRRSATVRMEAMERRQLLSAAIPPVTYEFNATPGVEFNGKMSDGSTLAPFHALVTVVGTGSSTVSPGINPATVEISHKLDDGNYRPDAGQLPLPSGTLTEAKSVQYQWRSRLAGMTIDRDANGYPLPVALSLDFEWGDGTGAIVNDNDAFNSATGDVVATHSYAIAGDYTVTVTVTDGSNVIATAQQAVHVANNTDGGLDLAATTAQTFSGVIGNFHVDPGALMTNATIDWGDSRSLEGSSEATLTDLGNGNYSVSGTHTFYDPGTFTIRVYASPTLLLTSPVVVSTITVSGPVAPISVTPLPLPHPVENVSTSISPAKFISIPLPIQGDPATGFPSASIDWGDGSPLSTDVQYGGFYNEFPATASHTYTKTGSYNITTTFYENSVAVSSVTQLLTVDPISTGGQQLSAQTGQLFNGSLGTFTDPGTAGKVDNAYDALIDWGDGITSAGTLVSLGNNQYRVDGMHQYASAGDYMIQVTTGFPPAAPPSTTPSPIFVGNEWSGSVVISYPSNYFYPPAPTTSLSIVSRMQVTGAPVVITQPEGTITLPSIPPLAGGYSAPITAKITGIDPHVQIPQIVINYGDGSAPVTQPALWVNDHFEAPLFAPYTNFEPTSYPTIFYYGSVPPYTAPGKYTLTIFATAGNQVLGTAKTPIIVSSVSLPGYATSISVTSPSMTSALTGQTTTGAWIAALKVPDTNSADFTATVNWGDGAHSRGSAAAFNSGSQVQINSQHTFQKPGVYHSVAVIKRHGKVVQILREKIVVQDDTPNGQSLHAKTAAVFSGTLGKLYYNTSTPLSAAIDWGDGTQSIGALANAGDSSSDVTGSHTYKKRGTYHITVTPLFTEGVIYGHLDASASQLIRSTIVVH